MWFAAEYVWQYFRLECVWAGLAPVSQRTFLGGLICFLLPAYVSKMLLVKWKTCQFLSTLTQVESEVLWFVIHQPHTASD